MAKNIKETGNDDSKMKVLEKETEYATDRDITPPGDPWSHTRSIVRVRV